MTDICEHEQAYIDRIDAIEVELKELIEDLEGESWINSDDAKTSVFEMAHECECLRQVVCGNAPPEDVKQPKPDRTVAPVITKHAAELMNVSEQAPDAGLRLVHTGGGAEHGFVLFTNGEKEYVGANKRRLLEKGGMVADEVQWSEIEAMADVAEKHSLREFKAMLANASS